MHPFQVLGLFLSMGQISRLLNSSEFPLNPFAYRTTGVAAMQLAIVSETKAIIYDKARRLH